MVLGKSLILALAINNSALAKDQFDPKFYEYTSNAPIHRLVTFSFGWFKKLDADQQAVYHQSITHALLYAENGDKVKWYKNNASGYSIPVMTWPTGSGYCRQLHLNAIAYGKQRSMSIKACYNNSTRDWSWYRE